jgi:hypothetical protein
MKPTTKSGTIATLLPTGLESFELRRFRNERITTIGARRQIRASLKTIAEATDPELKSEAVASTCPTSWTAAPVHDPKARLLKPAACPMSGNTSIDSVPHKEISPIA